MAENQRVLIPHSSSLIPHPSSLIPHSSFLIPHSSFLIINVQPHNPKKTPAFPAASSGMVVVLSVCGAVHLDLGGGVGLQFASAGDAFRWAVVFPRVPFLPRRCFHRQWSPNPCGLSESGTPRRAERCMGAVGAGTWRPLPNCLARRVVAILAGAYPAESPAPRGGSDFCTGRHDSAGYRL